MSGSSSRNRGHRFEVSCANQLSERTGLHVVTGRFFGLTYGADLVTVTGYDQLGRPVTYDPAVLGWSVECKAVARRNPGGWLKQADEQRAPGTTPVVLWRKKNYPWEAGSAFLLDEDEPRGWREMPISEWLEDLDDAEREAA